LLELLPNRDVVGIDLSENQVAAARARLPHGKFHVMAGENLELGRKFNFVILSETLNFAADAIANRACGETNIQRWRHGLLLRMLLLAIAKIKLI
jgi:hypothetical protein